MSSPYEPKPTPRPMPRPLPAQPYKDAPYNVGIRRNLALALLLACGACVRVNQEVTQTRACHLMLSVAGSPADSLRVLREERFGGFSCAQWIAAYPPVTPEANDAQK